MGVAELVQDVRFLLAAVVAVLVAALVVGEQRGFLAQELAVAGNADLEALLRARLAEDEQRLSATSCSVSMMIWRWLRRLCGLTSIGIAALSSSASSGGAGRRKV